METPHSKFAHVFAVLRYDEPIDASNWEDAVSVVKVFRNRARAESEAERLKSINKCLHGAVDAAWYRTDGP